MTIPPQSVPQWIALFGGISYSAWAFVAYSYRKGLAGTSLQRISKGKVPRFLYIYTNGAFGADFPRKISLLMCRNTHLIKWNCIQRISNLVIFLAIASILLFVILLFAQAYQTSWEATLSVLMKPKGLHFLLVAGFSLLTLWLTILTLNRSVKIEEMNAIVSLRDLFNQDGNIKVYRKILNGEPFYLTDKETPKATENVSEERKKELDEEEGNVNNYIGTLELAYLMVERGVINMEEFENLFGYRLNNLYENKDLHEYVCEDRKYNAILFRAIDALHKYQRERKQKY